MDRLTQPLHDEHRELLPQVDEIATVADHLDGNLTQSDLDQLTAVSNFLQRHLLRHAAAEEAALYPVVGWAIGNPEATATMSRDHREIARLTAELTELLDAAYDGAADVTALRRTLYGLRAIVVLHFAKEEEVYLPLLDQRLTPHDAVRLFADMEEATVRAA